MRANERSMRIFLLSLPLAMTLLLLGCGDDDDGPAGPGPGSNVEPFPDAVSVVQGPVTNPANGHVYYRLANSNWSAAERTAMVAFGAHLVSIADAAENLFVENTFANAAGSGRVWLGLTDRASEGTFVYTDGAALGYTQWEPGEPNNSGDEDFVAMYSGNGNWVDVQDLANPPGIGNIYGVIEVEVAAAAYVVQGPVVNPDNGNIYYRLNNTNYSAAKQFAEEVMGGHIVRIADADENQFVLTTFANAVPTGRVWLDLSDADEEGTFVWSDGSAPSYTNWEPGEPNDAGAQGEDYVAMYSGNGRWVDVRDEPDPGIGAVYGVVELELD